MLLKTSRVKNYFGIIRGDGESELMWRSGPVEGMKRRMDDIERMERRMRRVCEEDVQIERMKRGLRKSVSEVQKAGQSNAGLRQLCWVKSASVISLSTESVSRKEYSLSPALAKCKKAMLFSFSLI